MSEIESENKSDYNDKDKKDLIFTIEEMKNTIEKMKAEMILKDKKILDLEDEVSKLKTEKENEINNSFKKTSDLFLNSQSKTSFAMEGSIYKNLDFSREQKFNRKSSGSFLKNFIADYDNSLILSNSFINDMSISNSRRMNKSDLVNSTLNLKINEMEIDDLYDNEMENFIDKVKNTKIEEENIFENKPIQKEVLQKGDFTSFKYTPTKGDQSDNKKEKIRTRNRDFKKTMKENNEKVRSISTTARSAVKEYINKKTNIDVDPDKSFNKNKRKFQEKVKTENKFKIEENKKFYEKIWKIKNSNNKVYTNNTSVNTSHIVDKSQGDISVLKNTISKSPVTGNILKKNKFLKPKQKNIPTSKLNTDNSDILVLESEINTEKETTSPKKNIKYQQKESKSPIRITYK